MDLNFLYIFYFILFWTLIVCDNNEKCTKYNFEKYLSSKTPYRFIANYNSTKINYPGCKPIKFWALVRHGTRNPNDKVIALMRDRLPEIRDLILENILQPNEHFHNSDLDSFRKWSSKLFEIDAKKLTHEGEDEMLQLAERFQNRFPNLLDNIYSNTSYKFRFTATQRTKKSAKYFAIGLFGRAAVRDVEFPEPLKNDPILRFYKLCNKWRKEIKKNTQTVIERRKFESDAIIQKIIKQVNNRLGFDENEFDLTDIYTMYMVCAFETAWNKRKKSPWCSLFTIDDMKAIEYAEDLKYYWVDGYGHELTYRQACPAFNDMINYFESNDRFPKSTVYFTHSGTLLKMLAHMQLYRDRKHLIANDYHRQINRKWRVSHIDTFATNLAFVLFDCNGRRKILTLHQEKVVRLPSCPNTDLCEIGRVLDYYSETNGNCQFDAMCDNN